MSVPTVVDRLIQQALHQKLSPIFNPGFSESSYGFRPERSTHQAVLMARVARRVKDKRVLRLIRRYLQARIMHDGLVTPATEGTPQGGPLSPLLSNILLDELDRELERRGHAFCRYADDVNVYVASQRAGERVLQTLEQFLPKRLRLKLKEEFRRGRGRNLARQIEELRPLLQGWSAYFRLVEVKVTFERLDKWIRRRLRCIQWRQWKRPRTRAAKLIQAGLDQEQARQSAVNGRGPWWNAGAGHMNRALPRRSFDEHGLVNLLARNSALRVPT